MERKGSDPLVLLDACCLINLLATGRAEEILTALPYRCATSRLVAVEEVLSIAEVGESAGLAWIELVSDEKNEDFVRFSTWLDPGEASICALAVHHRAIVATDDRKALRVLRREAPLVSTLQTPELFYAWARFANPSDRETKEALQAVRVRARFYPRRDAPRFDWWTGFFPSG